MGSTWCSTWHWWRPSKTCWHNMSMTLGRHVGKASWHWERPRTGVLVHCRNDPWHKGVARHLMQAMLWLLSKLIRHVTQAKQATEVPWQVTFKDATRLTSGTIKGVQLSKTNRWDQQRLCGKLLGHMAISKAMH